MRTSKTFARITICFISFAYATLLSAVYKPTAIAQTSAEQITSDPQREYPAVRESMKRLYVETHGKAATEWPRDMRYWLVDCATGESFVFGSPGNMAYDFTRGDYLSTAMLRPLLDVAFRVVRLEVDLTAFKVPRDVWERLLHNYEADQLRKAKLHSSELRAIGREVQRFRQKKRPAKWIQEFAQQRELEIDDRRGKYSPSVLDPLKPLLNSLNSYRRKNRRTTLPEVILVTEGCGGGEINAQILTEPPGATVMFIPQFFHKVCELQQLNPEDPGSCDWWREAHASTFAGVIGEYFYKATWPDGTTKLGRFTVSDRSHKRVVIRKP